MFVQFIVPKGPDGTQYMRRIIDTCVAQCVERWGGCTVTEGTGWWIHPDTQEYISEPVAILSVECEPAYGESVSERGRESHKCVVRQWFNNLATYVRVKGDQHTVYYRMFDGGAARFVGPDTIVQPEPEHIEPGSFADKVCRSFDTGPS